MLAMTVKSDLASTRDAHSSSSGSVEHAESSANGDQCLPIYSGLSALIQAATSQFGHLVGDEYEDEGDGASEGKEYAPRGRSEKACVSSVNEEEHDSQPRTPTMVPEPDPRKHSFPELLMTLAMEPSNVDTITFLPDGKFFALRSHEFSKDIMVKYFAPTTFEEFLDLANDWGFSRILQDLPVRDIEVFRHPLFIKGDWERCSQIKFGESPTNARVSALPEMSKIEFTASDDSSCSGANTKRRLSPGFLNRRESESSVSSQKLRVASHGSRRDSVTAESEAGESEPPTKADELRSLALSITAEKLHLKHDTCLDDKSERGKLVERAVESATHTIVTDAIESLLRDEGHTKKTYLKHEEELSKSSLPGVIPISKQLFSPDSAANNGDSLPSEVPSTAAAVETSPPLPLATSSNGVPVDPLVRQGAHK